MNTKKCLAIIFVLFFSANAVESSCPPLKAESESEAMSRSYFKKDPIKYYKRYALAYCLGYDFTQNKTYSVCKGKETRKNPYHIENMVEDFGDKNLVDKIRKYIDESERPLLNKNEVNNCFGLIYNYQEFHKMLENFLANQNDLN